MKAPRRKVQVFQNYVPKNLLIIITIAYISLCDDYFVNLYNFIFNIYAYNTQVNF